MKTKKFLWAVLLVCLVLQGMNSFAQQKKIEYSERVKERKRDSLVMNSDYIVSGQIQNVVFFKDDKNNVFTAWKISIGRVYKGSKELVNQDITIIRPMEMLKYDKDAPYVDIYENSGYDGKFSYYKDIEHLYPYYEFGDNGIFFLKNNTFDISYLNDTNNINKRDLHELDLVKNSEIFCQFTTPSGNMIYNAGGHYPYNGIYGYGFYGMEWEGMNEAKQFITEYVNERINKEQSAGVKLKKSPKAAL